jgi:hypothetical protein
MVMVVVVWWKEQERAKSSEMQAAVVSPASDRPSVSPDNHQQPTHSSHAPHRLRPPRVHRLRREPASS